MQQILGMKAQQDGPTNLDKLLVELKLKMMVLSG